MSIISTAGHVSRAIDFYNKTELFMCFGRETPWDDENNPPTPTEESVLEEPLVYKSIEYRTLVVPDDVNGTLVFQDSLWRPVDINDAYTEGAKYVYIRTALAYSEWSTTTSYRQISVNQDLVRKEGVPVSQLVLTPQEVAFAGYQQFLDNRKPIYRAIDQLEQVVTIIQF